MKSSLKFFGSSTYIYCKVFGYLPLTYSRTISKFTTTKFSTLYALSFIIFVGIAYPYFFFTTYHGILVKIGSRMVVTVARFVMMFNTIAILSMLIYNIYYREKIADFFNKTIFLVHKLRLINRKLKPNTVLAYFIFKLYFFPIPTWYIYVTSIMEGSGLWHYIVGFILITPVMITFSLTNLLSSIINIMRLYIVMLNTIITEKSEQRKKCKDNNSDYQNMIRDCDLSDDIDKISMIYLELSEHIKFFNNLFSYHLLVGLFIFYSLVIFEVSLKSFHF